MVRYLALTLILLSFAGGYSMQAASPDDKLTPSQLAQLSNGKPLVLNKVIPGEPWPQMTIWQLIKCSPEQLAGVFWDSELDPSYLPGCLETKIVSRPTPAVQKALFRLKMPLFLPDEVYTSEIELIPQPPGSYKITWKVIESIYAKSCTGEILIQPHEGMALVRYRNFMVPRSKMAGLLKGPGVSRVAESFHALVVQTEKEVNSSSALLERQRKALQLAAGN
jgi:hypothetical protein